MLRPKLTHCSAASASVCWHHLSAAGVHGWPTWLDTSASLPFPCCLFKRARSSPRRLRLEEDGLSLLQAREASARGAKRMRRRRARLCGSSEGRAHTVGLGSSPAYVFRGVFFVGGHAQFASTTAGAIRLGISNFEPPKRMTTAVRRQVPGSPSPPSEAVSRAIC